MVKDTQVVSELFISKSTNDIVKFGVGDSLGVVDKTLTYEQMKDSINDGQRYETQSYEGDPGVLTVNKDGIISTNRDDTNLNNLRGKSDIKITMVD